jgi:hypothetical protein
MNTRSLLCSLIVIISITARLSAADAPSLDPHLEPLRPWLGKTWKGQFKDSKPEKPTIDISRWERALNGKAVRIVHSINDGAYGGETILMWDESKQTLTYHYFTTAGFMTKGTMSFKEGIVHTHEVVTGREGGVTEVRGQTEMRPDGTFHVKTEHLKDGVWSPGRETTYREDAAANVVFK